MNWKTRFVALVAGILRPDRQAVTVALGLFLTVFFTALGVSQQTAAVLVVQSNPGGAQVYVDDELRGTTSQQGRLRVSTLRLGKHSLRVSLNGYQDWQEEISCVAGQTVTRTATLGQAATKQDEEPSLEDTLQWMKNALNSQGGSGEIYRYTNGGNNLYGHRSELGSVSGCNVGFVDLQDIILSTPNGRSETTSGKRIEAVTLRDLDPSSLKAEKVDSGSGNGYTKDGFGFRVTVKTTNLVNTISDTTIISSKDGADQVKNNPKGSSLTIFVYSEEVGERLAKALAHAITICGGKSSTF